MTMREELIIAAQDALDANWRENHRMMATAALDAILAGLDDPSEEMEESAREQWELGSPSSILRAMLKPLKGE